MTTTEHLQLIKAECERLLAIAEKRTQGEWTMGFTGNGFPCVVNRDSVSITVSDLACTGFGQREADANYIAACARRAEAGWDATIAAIDKLLIIRDAYFRETCGYQASNDAINDILAAWPIELLKP
jgi:hypothetical protein